jgi:hypothetical protein
MKLVAKEKNNRLPSYLLFAILIIAFIIRLLHGLSYGFSNDELSALSRIRYDNLYDLINKGVAVDFHPALVQVFLYFWTKLFGTSLLAVRFPFILAGTLSIWVIFEIGLTWFNRTTGFIAAVFIAFLGYTILYSEIARPYSFGLLFSSLTLLYWSKVFIAKEISWRNFLLLGLWVLLSMYTHYYSFLVSGLIFATGLFFLNKKTILKYLSASALFVILYLPFVPVFILQLSRGGVGGSDGWLGKPTSDWLWNYIVYAFNDSFLLVFIAVIGFISAIISVIKNKNYAAFLLPIWFFILFLFGYIYSIQVNPILQNSVLIFCFPCLVIFVAYGLSNLNKILNPILSVVLIALVVFATTDKSGFFKKQHFGLFDYPANDFIEWSSKTPQDKTFSIIDVHNRYYIDYYLDKDDTTPNIYHLETLKSQQLFIDALYDPNIEYLIYGWSTKQPSSEIYLAIQHAFPYTLEDRIYFNSRMSLFSRTNPNKLETSSEKIIKEQTMSIDPKKQYFSPKREYGANNKMQNVTLPDSIPLKIDAVVSLSSIDSLKGLLVIDVVFENGDKLWKGKNLSLYRGFDSTYFAFTSLVIPDNTKGIKELKVYIWNNKKETFNVFNVQVQIIENKEGYVYLPQFYN